MEARVRATSTARAPRRQGGPGAADGGSPQPGGEQAGAAPPAIGSDRQQGQAEQQDEGDGPGAAAAAVHGGELQVGDQRGEHRQVGSLAAQAGGEHRAEGPEDHGEQGDDPGQGQDRGDAGADDVEGIGDLGSQGAGTRTEWGR